MDVLLLVIYMGGPCLGELVGSYASLPRVLSPSSGMRLSSLPFDTFKCSAPVADGLKKVVVTPGWGGAGVGGGNTVLISTSSAACPFPAPESPGPVTHLTRCGGSFSQEPCETGAVITSGAQWRTLAQND